MGKRDEHDAVDAPAKAEAPTELMTVQELAAKHGQTQPTPVPGDSPFRSEHLVADVRHGWQHHTHFVGGPVRLSDADYLAAIEAAKDGKVHAPANRRSAEHEAMKQKSRDEAKALAEAAAKKGR